MGLMNAAWRAFMPPDSFDQIEMEVIYHHVLAICFGEGLVIDFAVL
jgi:hypothetical protein